MERLVGHNFAGELARHPGGLPVEQVVDVAGQVAAALGAAHAQGVVHRDVKPANLFLQDSGLVKICDFGISRLANATHLLTGFQVAGTLPYMAPEQFATLAVDHRSDLYALGCVLYELLAGRTWVDPGADWPAAMYQHVEVAPPRPAASRPDIPEELDRLVLDLLAKDPADRPADASAVAARLRGIGQQPRRGPGTTDGTTDGQRLEHRTRLLTEAATLFRALHVRRAAEAADNAYRLQSARARRTSAPDRAAGQGRASHQGSVLGAAEHVAVDATELMNIFCSVAGDHDATAIERLQGQGASLPRLHSHPSTRGQVPDAAFIGHTDEAVVDCREELDGRTGVLAGRPSGQFLPGAQVPDAHRLVPVVAREERGSSVHRPHRQQAQGGGTSGQELGDRSLAVEVPDPNRPVVATGDRVTTTLVGTGNAYRSRESRSPSVAHRTTQVSASSW